MTENSAFLLLPSFTWFLLGQGMLASLVPETEDKTLPWFLIKKELVDDHEQCPPHYLKVDMLF